MYMKGVYAINAQFCFTRHWRTVHIIQLLPFKMSVNQKQTQSLDSKVDDADATMFIMFIKSSDAAFLHIKEDRSTAIQRDLTEYAQKIIV